MYTHTQVCHPSLPYLISEKKNTRKIEELEVPNSLVRKGRGLSWANSPSFSIRARLNRH